MKASVMKTSTAARLYYDYAETDLGLVIMAGTNDGLSNVVFQDGKKMIDPPSHWQHSAKRLADPIRQIKEYFAGKRKQFDVQLAPCGTEFQQKVWQALRKIPYGESITYGELAKRVGKPKASRAVGNANGKNPIVIIQPCHRVVAAGGKLGGFSSGLHRKEYLLELEKKAPRLF